MAEVIPALSFPVATPSTKARPIISDKLRPRSQIARPVFDPSKHLSFVSPPRTLTLKDIDLPEDAGISPLAVSDPFPLFSEEAIQVMRSEIFTKEIWDNCLHSTEFAGCQLRGHCPKYAPFMYDAWKNAKTLSIVSNIAGVDLIPNIDLEIGNINIAVQDLMENTSVEGHSTEENSVTKWHYDSYPIVCVVMMSDASTMIGGETAVRTGSGEILKVRGPQMGSAILLQGRVISHQALAAVGGKERITMITSFRPRDPFMVDDSVLTSIRPISDLSELYYQWTKYRVEVLEERLRGMLRVLEEQHRAERKTDAERIKRFLKEQEEWLAITEREIIP